MFAVIPRLLSRGDAKDRVLASWLAKRRSRGTFAVGPTLLNKSPIAKVPHNGKTGFAP